MTAVENRPASIETRVAGAPRPRQGRTSRVLTPISGFVAVLVGWQIAGAFINPIYISTPASVAENLGQLLFGRQQIWGDILPSLGEMYLGLAIALVGGLVIGILLGSSRMFAAITTPYLVFLNATPLVITLPLLTVWVGTTLKARIVFISLLAIWPVLLNVAAGCRNVSGRYRELGKALGLSRSRQLRRIVLPGVLPYFLAGARISSGLVVVGMIVAEMEVSVTGLGYLLASYGGGFQTAKLLAVFVFVSLIGMVNVGVLLALTRWLAPWTGAARQPG
jgi:NitT/TauT family transport system permease protein